MFSILLIPNTRVRDGRSPRNRQRILVFLQGDRKRGPLDYLKGRSFHQHPHLCFLLYLCFIVGDLFLRLR
jgi:hypothetical protein